MKSAWLAVLLLADGVAAAEIEPVVVRVVQSEEEQKAEVDRLLQLGLEQFGVGECVMI